MLQQAPPAPRGAPHVIVVGNEKGGSGKTTIAIHVAVALLKAGQRVATIDLDSNQKSLTQYIENRRIWANYRRIDLEIPAHRYIPRVEGAKLEENEAEELATFKAAISECEHRADFLVIDTPATDTYLMRLAHLLADTLLTPLHDSFLDFGTLASVDPITQELIGSGHYAAMVCDARRRRRQFDCGFTEWVVIRNRFSLSPLVDHSVGKLGMRLGFRDIEGCAERVVYRQLFLAGLTALDGLDQSTLGDQPNRSYLAASQEMRDLLASLKLPIDDRQRRRAAARAEWFACARTPLETHDLIAD